MTTVQSMLSRRCAALGLLAAAIGASSLGSCAKPPELTPPETLVSPYDTSGPDVLWAVAPLANESGTSAVDPLAVSDTLVNTVTQVEGLAAVPMNRTLAAMRALNMPAVRSASDARSLADLLGADAVIVGTITAFDPYNPPKLGLALALFARDGPGPQDALDPRTMQRAYSEGRPAPAGAGRVADQPAAVVSEMLDGANHAVRMSLQRYADGRHERASALGWKRYLASMDLYTEFASFWTVKRLLDEERLRLARPVARTAAAGR